MRRAGKKYKEQAANDAPRAGYFRACNGDEIIQWRFRVAVVVRVALHWARLVVGWVTAFWQVNGLTM